VARLSDTVRAALGYWWNLISDAARSGFTVTETIQIANQIAEDTGRKLAFAENTSISELYGYARRMENAGNTFQSADPALGITSDMIATPPWARDIAEQLAYPTYHVKFEYNYLDSAGNIQSTTKTSVFSNGIPGTVGELTASVLDDAEAMAAKYGHALLSAVPFQILAV